MPRMSPSARQALVEERRSQILRAAAKVFAAKGYERATIADIARAARVAEGSIYNYFKNKEDVLVTIPSEMIRLPLESVSAQISTLDADDLEPERVLRLVATNIIATILQNADIFRVLISTLPIAKRATRSKYMREVVMHATGVLEAYFQELIDQGIFLPGQKPQVLARAFIGMLFPFVVLRVLIRVEEEQDWDFDAIVDALVPLFLHGARAGAPERISQ